MPAEEWLESRGKKLISVEWYKKTEKQLLRADAIRVATVLNPERKRSHSDGVTSPHGLSPALRQLSWEEATRLIRNIHEIKHYTGWVSNPKRVTDPVFPSDDYFRKYWEFLNSLQNVVEAVLI